MWQALLPTWPGMLPVVKGAAQVSLGAASFGFEVTHKVVEVFGPVAIEGSKLVMPALAGGFRTLSYAMDHNGDLAIQLTPPDVSEVLHSPFVLALADASPWVLALLSLYLVGQVVINLVKDALASLVPPTVAILSLGTALTIGLKTEAIVIDPTPFAFAAVAGVILLLPAKQAGDRVGDVAGDAIDEAAADAALYEKIEEVLPTLPLQTQKLAGESAGRADSASEK